MAMDPASTDDSMNVFENSGTLGLSHVASKSASSPVPALLVSSTVNLRRLVILRTVMLAGQAFAVAVAVGWLKMPLPLVWLILILALVTGVNVLTWLRLRAAWPVRDAELFAHLTFDVSALTALLYFTGGSTNPFAPLYLLPLTFTAVALPGRYAWAMVVLTTVCYSALLQFYVPLPSTHAGPGHDFRLHVVGMWIGFWLSAILIAYFVVRVRETLRERERLRAQMREQELRHERVLALGTLAAGAAHELGTPLSTIAVLAGELERDRSRLPEKLRVLREQIARCKEILASLAAGVGEARAEGGGEQPLDAYLNTLIQRWRAARPQVEARLRLEGVQPAPRIVTEQTFGQALLNILNNAADASPDEVELDARWTSATLTFEVRDRGAGMTAAAEEHAGEPFFSTKTPGGMGLGLFLARGTIERLAGSVSLANRDGGGAVCRVQLPLGGLRVSDP
jgi:two-component system, sensor histidine kinase RegB